MIPKFDFESNVNLIHVAKTVDKPDRLTLTGFSLAS